jgi:hypothetical protein
MKDIKELLKNGYKVKIYKFKNFITEISFTKKTTKTLIGVSFQRGQIRQRDLRNIVNFLVKNKKKGVINGRKIC